VKESVVVVLCETGAYVFIPVPPLFITRRTMLEKTTETIQIKIVSRWRGLFYSKDTRIFAIVVQAANNC
jgi:hypothetical protein